MRASLEERQWPWPEGHCTVIDECAGHSEMAEPPSMLQSHTSFVVACGAGGQGLAHAR
jgi:hypothetical protein